MVSVTKIAAMLAKSTETTPPTLPAAAGITGGRFARDNTEYLTTRPAATPSEARRTPAVQLTLIPGGSHTPEHSNSDNQDGSENP